MIVKSGTALSAPQPSMDETLGDRLTMLMRRAGLKNPDVADVTDADPTTVSKWRSGVQQPSDAKLSAIVQLLRSRGVHTSVHELRHGLLKVGERATAYHTQAEELEFEDLPAKQRAKVWLEGFLLELAERGAAEPFIASTRRFLLNPENYEPGFSAEHTGPMDDGQKLRHMKALAVGVRATLSSRGSREGADRGAVVEEAIAVPRPRAASAARSAKGAKKPRRRAS